jgi:hypothetical protein
LQLIPPLLPLLLSMLLLLLLRSPVLVVPVLLMLSLLLLLLRASFSRVRMLQDSVLRRFTALSVPAAILILLLRLLLLLLLLLLLALIALLLLLQAHWSRSRLLALRDSTLTRFTALAVRLALRCRAMLLLCPKVSHHCSASSTDRTSLFAAASLANAGVTVARGTSCTEVTALTDRTRGGLLGCGEDGAELKLK